MMKKPKKPASNPPARKTITPKPASTQERTKAYLLEQDKKRKQSIISGPAPKTRVNKLRP
jgi:hypothetical protein